MWRNDCQWISMPTGQDATSTLTLCPVPLCAPIGQDLRAPSVWDAAPILRPNLDYCAPSIEYFILASISSILPFNYQTFHNFPAPHVVYFEEIFYFFKFSKFSSAYLSVFFVFQRFFSNRFLDFVSILSVVVLLMMRNSENLQRKSYLQCHGNFIQLSSFRSYINAH